MVFNLKMTMDVLKASVVYIALLFLTVSSSSVKFETFQVCSSTVAIVPLSTHVGIPIRMHCSVLCSSDPDCLSYTYVAATPSCSLYNAKLNESKGCENNIDYGEKVLHVSSLSVCTQTVDNLRLCSNASTGIEVTDGIAGHIGIFVNNTWGRLCEANIGSDEYRVICGMMGYLRSDKVDMDIVGAGDGPIYDFRWDCRGDETSLSLCEDKGMDKCYHEEAAAVKCTDPK